MLASEFVGSSGSALWQLLAASCSSAAAAAAAAVARFPAFVDRLGGAADGCVRVSLEASGLSTPLTLPLEVLWGSWLPLVLLLDGRLRPGKRLLVGLVGPAGSGKTTTAELGTCTRVAGRRP